MDGILLPSAPIRSLDEYLATDAGGLGIRYVVANGAEGEPGTFKERALMRSNPYQVVEGVIVAGFAVSAARKRPDWTYEPA